VILKAFADDSGNSDLSNYYALAGYVMQEPAWERFADEWDATLKARPYPIKCFKAADAESGMGYFSGVPREFRKLAVKELSRVIEHFSPLAIYTYLRWDDYNAIVSGNVPVAMDSPYAVLFYQLIRTVHDFQLRQVEENPHWGLHRTEWVFDEQGEVGIRVGGWYEGLKRNAPKPYRCMFGNRPDFRSDEEILPLQAADMLAWNICRELERPTENLSALARIREFRTWRPIGHNALKMYVEMFSSSVP
jgi:hypothetical protein